MSELFVREKLTLINLFVNIVDVYRGMGYRLFC
jgi:hypothetical protein